MSSLIQCVKTGLFAAAAVSSLWLGGCGKSESGNATTQGGGGSQLQIACIAKSTVNAYWKAVEAGAKQAASEDNVDLIWTGPDSETNHTQQASMVDNMVNRGVKGIVIAPTNFDAMVRPVDNAVQRGIPVIVIDSPVNTKSPSCVIATDNEAAGRQAADALAAAIGNNKKFGGKVIMLRFLEGSGSTEAREKGFTEECKAKGLDLVDQAYTKGTGSTTDAADTADALIRRNTKDNALQVDGIFAANQPTAIGMLKKIEQFKSGGMKFDMPFVGFDAHEILLKGIRDGEVAAIVTQDPRQMGYLGVKNMVKLLHKEPVPPTISTATATVTKQNIDDPKIKAITLE